MRKIYKIIIILAFSLNLMSCKNSAQRQVKGENHTVLKEKASVNAIAPKTVSSEEISPSIPAKVPADRKNPARRIAQKMLIPDNLIRKSEPQDDSKTKDPVEESVEGYEALEPLYPAGVYNSDTVVEDTQIVVENTQTKEFTSTFVEEEAVDGNEIENSNAKAFSKNILPVSRHEVSSSTLSPPVINITANAINRNPANLADRFDIKTPRIRLSSAGGNRNKPREMGRALPTSLQDAYELIIEVTRLQADMIEKMLSEGISCDEIIRDIGLSDLIENNSVESILRINSPSRPDSEGILYKITFDYPVEPEDYDRIKVSGIITEPNYFIENLTLEANLLGTNVNDWLKLYKYYITELNLQWYMDSYFKDRPAGEGITVAVIDTGVDYYDPQLNDKIIKVWNVIDNNEDVTDCDGHGTNVARIICKTARSNIIVIKALTGKGGTIEDLYQAIIYAADNGADVINLSLGGTVESELINVAIDYAFSKNIVLVGAGGNIGSDICNFPANNPKVFRVGGTNMFTNPTYYSNRSEDLAAPGNLIYLDEITGYISGTSFSTPFVSGAVAQLLSMIYEVRPDRREERVNPMEVLYILKREALDKNKGLLNLSNDLPLEKYLQEGIMCRIISAKAEDGIMEIGVLGQYKGAGDSYFSLSYAEGINPGQDYETITRFYENPIDKTIRWDTSGLPGGYYTLRLVLHTSSNGGIMDRHVVRIDNELYNEKEDITFLWNPSGSVNNIFEIINPHNSKVEITPIFYDNSLLLGGREVRSQFTATIEEEGVYPIDLREFKPSYLQDILGPVGIEVNGYLPEEMRDSFGKAGFVSSDNVEKNMLVASWEPYIPNESEREDYHDKIWKWHKKVEEEKDWELKDNSDNMPRIQKEAMIVLYNPTDDDASVNITYYADGSRFDTLYNIYIPNWYWGGDLGDNLHFYKVRFSNREDGPYPIELYTLNDSRQIYYWEKPSEEERKQVLPYWRYRSIYPAFIHVYSLVTKLDESYNGRYYVNGSYKIEWSSLVLYGSLNVPARSYISIPTWSFLWTGPYRGPLGYYCADACMVSNIYPKGSVFGAVVQERSGIPEEVIPLHPAE